MDKQSAVPYSYNDYRPVNGILFRIHISSEYGTPNNYIYRNGCKGKYPEFPIVILTNLISDVTYKNTSLLRCFFMRKKHS